MVSLASRGHPVADLVQNMAANLERVASLLLEVLEGGAADQVCEILERERVGDELLCDLLTYLESGSMAVDALAHDDLQGLGVALEDALDDLAAAAEAVRVYRLSRPPDEVRELARVVVRGAVLLRRSLGPTAPEDSVRRHWVELIRLEREGASLADGVRVILRSGGSVVAARWADVVDLVEGSLHRVAQAGAIVVAALLQPA
jgi:hypothetical protein